MYGTARKGKAGNLGGLFMACGPASGWPEPARPLVERKYERPHQTDWRQDRFGGSALSVMRGSGAANAYQWHDGPVRATVAFQPDQTQSTTQTSTHAYTVIGGQAQLASVSFPADAPQPSFR
jgi:hypothetical protein